MHIECLELCNYCKHYLDDGIEYGSFIGAGKCLKNNEKVDSHFYCPNDFEPNMEVIYG